MNIDKIRSKIQLYKGQKLSFRFNGSRNQIEEFKAIVLDTYHSVFIVKLEETEMIKSFSYSDILIRKLILTVPQ